MSDMTISYPGLQGLTGDTTGGKHFTGSLAEEELQLKLLIDLLIVLHPHKNRIEFNY